MSGIFTPKIALFTYDFNHWKSISILKDCIQKRFDIKVILSAPKIDLRTGNPINYDESKDLRQICKKNNIFFKVISHENIDEINKIVNVNKCNLGIIGGARKIKKKIIDNFSYGIINYHPGKLPETAGLNAVERAISLNIPITISAHLINEKLDDGFLLLEQEVPIIKTDNILSLKKRCLEFQVFINSTVLKMYSNNMLNPYKLKNRRYNNKMDSLQIKSIENKFQKWKNLILLEQ